MRTVYDEMREDGVDVNSFGRRRTVYDEMREEQAAREQAENEGVIDNLIKGFKSGVAGVYGGIADLVHADSVGDYFNDVAQSNRRSRDFDSALSLDYITDPSGLAYDLGSQGGSILSMLPAAFLAPEGMVGAGAAALGRTGLAKLLGDNALRMAVRGAATSVPEAMAEGGGVRRQALEMGLDSPDARAWATTALNLPTLAISNGLEYALLGGGMFNPARAAGESTLRSIAKAPLRAAPTAGANAAQNGMEELLQQTFQDAATDQEYGLTPWTLTPQQRLAAEVGAIGGGVFGGGAGMVHGLTREEQAEPEPIPQEEPSNPTPQAINTGHEDIDALVAEAAGRYNVPQDLIHKVIYEESRYDPSAVSEAGAQGLMQLMPETAAGLGVQDSFDVAQNIDGGVKYLRQLLDMYGGDQRRALAAYNAGPNNMQAGLGYADRVLGHEVAGAPSGNAPSGLPTYDQKHYEILGEVSDTNLDTLTEQKLNALAHDFQQQFGESLGVTSMRRHGDGSSWHDSGQAFDVAGGILESSEEARAWLIERGKQYGLVPLDEYANPSAHATGGHIHFSDHGEAVSGVTSAQGQQQTTSQAQPQTQQQEEEQPINLPTPTPGMTYDQAADILGLSNEEVLAAARDKITNEVVPSKNLDLLTEIQSAYDNADIPRLREFLQQGQRPKAKQPEQVKLIQQEETPTVDNLQQQAQQQPREKVEVENVLQQQQQFALKSPAKNKKLRQQQGNSLLEMAKNNNVQFDAGLIKALKQGQAKAITAAQQQLQGVQGIGGVQPARQLTLPEQAMQPVNQTDRAARIEQGKILAQVANERGLPFSPAMTQALGTGHYNSLIRAQQYLQRMEQRQQQQEQAANIVQGANLYDESAGQYGRAQGGSQPDNYGEVISPETQAVAEQVGADRRASRQAGFEASIAQQEQAPTRPEGNTPQEYAQAQVTQVTAQERQARAERYVAQQRDARNEATSNSKTPAYSEDAGQYGERKGQEPVAPEDTQVKAAFDQLLQHARERLPRTKDELKRLKAEREELIDLEVNAMQNEIGEVGLMPDQDPDRAASGRMIRYSTHPEWYRKYYAEHGRKPSKAAMREIAEERLRNPRTREEFEQWQEIENNIAKAEELIDTLERGETPSRQPLKEKQTTSQNEQETSQSETSQTQREEAQTQSEVSQETQAKTKSGESRAKAKSSSLSQRIDKAVAELMKENRESILNWIEQLGGKVTNGHVTFGKGAAVTLQEFAEQLNAAGVKYSISAWHGSPHDFGGFSINGIGTGEGMQAHGWGLYFAKLKRTADRYRSGLSQTGTIRIGQRIYTEDGLGWVDENEDTVDGGLYDALESLFRNNGNKTATIRYLKSQSDVYAQRLPEKAAEYHRAIDLLRKSHIEINRDKGRLYNVAIPDADVMLDEQKPLLQQSEKVLLALKDFGVDGGLGNLLSELHVIPDVGEKLSKRVLKILQEYGDEKTAGRLRRLKTELSNTSGVTYSSDWYIRQIDDIGEFLAQNTVTGRVIYNRLRSKLGTPKAASLALHKVGIEGITYDGYQDGRCYVVFDDNAIKLVKKYSAASERIEDLEKTVRYLSPDKLTNEQKSLREFGEQMGTPVVFFTGAKELNGYHVGNVTYINANGMASMNNIFWHESFHWMKYNNPELYGQMVKEINESGYITERQAMEYALEHDRPDLDYNGIVEEMLSDEMPSVSKRAPFLLELAKRNRGLIERIVSWLRNAMNQFVDYFRPLPTAASYSKQGKGTMDSGLTPAQRKAMLRAFGKLMGDMRDQHGRKIFKADGMGGITLADGKELPQVTKGTAEKEHSIAVEKPVEEREKHYSLSSRRNTNSKQSLTQKIKNIFIGGAPSQSKRENIRRMLEDVTNMSIQWGKFDPSLPYDKVKGVIRAKHAYDWEKLLPECGRAIAERLGIANPSEKMKNYIADWLLTGAPNNTSQEAKDFAAAMRKDPDLSDRITDVYEMFQDWRQMERNERMKSQVQMKPEKKSSVRDWLQDKYNTFVEELEPIHRLEQNVEKKIGRKLDAAISPMLKFRLFRGHMGRAQAMLLGKGKPAVDALKEAYPALDWSNFKTLHDILNSIGAVKNDKIMKDFATYCIAKHTLDIHAKNRQLKAQGKEQYETMYSEEDCRGYIADFPQFAQAQKDIVNFSNQTLALLHESGLITNSNYIKTKNTWKNYVPMFRVFEENDDIDFGDSMKHMTGSKRDVINPIESIMRNTVDFIKRSEKNKAKCVLANLARMSDVGEYVTEVKNTNPNTMTHISFFENGERKYLNFQDPAIAKAINMMNMESSNAFWKLLKFPAKVARACFVGINPAFWARNIWRDTADATIYSKFGYKPWDFIGGFLHMWRKDRTYYDWLTSGAAQASRISLNRDYTQSAINKLTKRSLANPSTWVDFLEGLSEYSENAVRIAVFERAREGLAKQKLDKASALAEAALESRDLMDFGRSGSSSRTWNDLAIFANVAIQGWDKTFRAFDPRKPNRKEMFRALARLSFWGLLPTLVAFALNHDDEEYKNMADWQKEMHWIIRLGDNLTIRIPKGQDLALRFCSNLLEKTLAYMVDKEPLKLKQLLEPVRNAMPSLAPTALLPLAEAWGNYSLFRDRPIVPQREQKLPDYMQFNYQTSSFAKWLGEKIGLSPRKIDYVIKGYTGNVGDNLLNIYDIAAGYKQLNMAKEKLPVISGFLVAPYENPKSVQNYYEKWDEQSKLYEAYKRTHRKPADFDPKLYARLKALQKPMQALSAKERRVVEDTRLSPDKRREIQTDIQKRRIELTKGLPK